MYSDIQVVNMFEGVRARSSSLNSHSLFLYSSVVACTNCFSLNQPDTHSLLPAFSVSPDFAVSPEQSLQSLSIASTVSRTHKCVCGCDDLYQALQCVDGDLFQALQTIYVHQGRIEPPQCVVYSPHALALGNKEQNHRIAL